jgi:hypothetical protein
MPSVTNWQINRPMEYPYAGVSPKETVCRSLRHE